MRRRARTVGAPMADFDLYADVDFAPVAVEVPPPPQATLQAAPALRPPPPRPTPPWRASPRLATAPAASSRPKAAVVGGVDLYGDLEDPLSAPPSATPVSTPAPSTSRGGSLLDFVGAADGDDNEAVSSLLEFLSVAEEPGAAPGDVSGSDTEPEEIGARAKPRSVVMSIDPSASGPAKRPRLSGATSASESRSGAATAAPKPAADEGDFDFEAELQSSSTGGAVAVVGGAGIGPRSPGFFMGAGASPSSASTATPSARSSAPSGASADGYRYNPQTKRWEQGAGAGPWGLPSGGMGSAMGAGFGLGAATSQGNAWARSRQGGCVQPVRLKATMCRHFLSNTCRWGSECWFAHGEAEIRKRPNMEHLKRRFILQCSEEAKADADSGVCDYLQALAVRLALRFEERPEEMVASMAQAGLPAGADQRTTVKALLRLCHPDKCRHPDAKKAVQILGPLLTKTQ